MIVRRLGTPVSSARFFADGIDVGISSEAFEEVPFPISADPLEEVADGIDVGISPEALEEVLFPLEEEAPTQKLARTGALPSIRYGVAVVGASDGDLHKAR